MSNSSAKNKGYVRVNFYDDRYLTEKDMNIDREVVNEQLMLMYKSLMGSNAVALISSKENPIITNPLDVLINNLVVSIGGVMTVIDNIKVSFSSTKKNLYLHYKDVELIGNEDIYKNGKINVPGANYTGVVLNIESMQNDIIYDPKVYEQDVTTTRIQRQFTVSYDDKLEGFNSVILLGVGPTDVEIMLEKYKITSDMYWHFFVTENEAKVAGYLKEGDKVIIWNYQEKGFSFLVCVGSDGDYNLNNGKQLKLIMAFQFDVSELDRLKVGRADKIPEYFIANTLGDKYGYFKNLYDFRIIGNLSINKSTSKLEYWNDPNKQNGLVLTEGKSLDDCITENTDTRIVYSDGSNLSVTVNKSTKIISISKMIISTTSSGSKTLLGYGSENKSKVITSGGNLIISDTLSTINSFNLYDGILSDSEIAKEFQIIPIIEELRDPLYANLKGIKIIMDSILLNRKSSDENLSLIKILQSTKYDASNSAKTSSLNDNSEERLATANGLKKLEDKKADKTYVDTSITEILGGVSVKLNSLGKIALALGNDHKFYETVSTSLGNKADKSVKVSAGNGLIGGGTLGNDIEISLVSKTNGIKVEADGITLDVVNNLVDGGSGKALGADMGPTIKAMLEAIQGGGARSIYLNADDYGERKFVGNLGKGSVDINTGALLYNPSVYVGGIKMPNAWFTVDLATGHIALKKPYDTVSGWEWEVIDKYPYHIKFCYPTLNMLISSSQVVADISIDDVISILGESTPDDGDHRLVKCENTKKLNGVDIGNGRFLNEIPNTRIKTINDRITASVNKLIDDMNTIVDNDIVKGYEVTVGGDADKYYPVTIAYNRTLKYKTSYLEINKFVHNLAQNDGSLRIKFHDLCSTEWGGYPYSEYFVTCGGDVSKFVAKYMTAGNNDGNFVIWLRGGGRSYNFISDYIKRSMVTVNLSRVEVSGSPGNNNEHAVYADIMTSSELTGGYLPRNLINRDNLTRMCGFRIGEIFTTTDPTNPATIWPGTTWRKIENRFLYGSGTSKQLGGSNSVALSVANMPAHNHSASGSCDTQGWHAHNANHGHSAWQDGHAHTQPAHTHNYSDSMWTGAINSGSRGYWDNDYRDGTRTTASAGGENTGSAQPAVYVNENNFDTAGNGSHSHNIGVSIGNNGSGSAFNIMPQYETVHFWERLS